jgi:hypothetical protein
VTAQMVGVDLRAGEYLVCAYSKTAQGIWVLDGAPDRLPADSSAAELGAAVDNALRRSRHGVDDLTRDSEPARPLLDLLGLPDFATYAKGTRSVEVYRDGDDVEVTPRRNDGPRRGFTPLDEDITTLSAASADRLGAEVITAFEKAL